MKTLFKDKIISKPWQISQTNYCSSSYKVIYFYGWAFTEGVIITFFSAFNLLVYVERARGREGREREYKSINLLCIYVWHFVWLPNFLQLSLVYSPLYLTSLHVYLTSILKSPCPQAFSIQFPPNLHTTTVTRFSEVIPKPFSL